MQSSSLSQAEPLWPSVHSPPPPRWEMQRPLSQSPPSSQSSPAAPPVHSPAPVLSTEQKPVVHCVSMLQGSPNSAPLHRPWPSPSATQTPLSQSSGAPHCAPGLPPRHSESPVASRTHWSSPQSESDVHGRCRIAHIDRSRVDTSLSHAAVQSAPVTQPRSALHATAVSERPPQSHSNPDEQPPAASQSVPSNSNARPPHWYSGGESTGGAPPSGLLPSTGGRPASSARHTAPSGHAGRGASSSEPQAAHITGSKTSNLTPVRVWPIIRTEHTRRPRSG